MKGFIVYPDYDFKDEKTFVKLFGRLENGQSFVILQEMTPYFFINSNNIKKAEKILKDIKKEKTNLTNFQGHPVIKIIHNNYKKLQEIASSLHEKNIETYEADIKPNYRYMMDQDLLGTVDIEGDYISSEKVERVYTNADIKKASFKPKLKIVSIDVETDEHGNIFCIGIYSDKIQENFFVTSQKNLKHVTQCSSEEDCIDKFKQKIIELDPDIITGWNLIDFDLRCIHEASKKHKTMFDLGRDNNNIRLRIESNFFRSSSADIPGRLALDGLSLIKDPFLHEAPSIKHVEFDSYTLEDVSQAILGKGKLIKGKQRHKEIKKLYSQGEHQKLADYNLLDCQLAYEILEKTDLINLAIERSMLTGMPLDRITASIAAFDSLYIREARKRGYVSPTATFQRKETKLKGGYVFSLKPGIFNNVIILDFKSLYPSVIKTFNIDPASFSEKKIQNSIESPNKVYFKNQDGILPGIITRLHHEREKAKVEKKELANFAIKTIMNSFWGVLATPNCRYFNFNMASAITAFCRWIIQLTAKKIEELGYKVIYSDTDSVFIETKLEKSKANALGIEIQDYINGFYRDYTKKTYNRQSFLELEFKKQYLSMILPKIRGQDENEGEQKAAKKRYAGLVEEDGKENLEIIGLEAIRGDWTEAAKDFQKELLLKLFKHEQLEPFIKSYIKQIRSGKLDNLLIYRKSIRKDLDEYTKTTPPHVKAARQLDNLDSNIIQYYITEKGPEPIQKLRHKLDYEHYIDKQIKPIANQILSLIDKKFEDIVKDGKQSTLF